jgi:pimeloyl-ACP methyl ester carboxylesterase
MAARKKEVRIVLESIDKQAVHDGVEELFLHTNVGTITARYHQADGANAAIVWVGGAGGGLDGPAAGLYPRLAGQLTGQPIASLRLHYRFPNDLENCVIDTLMGVSFLKHQRGHQQMALVGHSFGGAVVISAGALSEDVVAVAALSSQTYGTSLATELSPRPLLLMHGMADEILPDLCSRQIYERAKEPKEIRLYPGCRHGLDECRPLVDTDLLGWLTDKLR